MFDFGASAINVGLANLWEKKHQSEQNQWNWRSQEAQRKWSEAQTTLAYQRDLEQWNRANAYNSPEQQMARLKGAGLNPNMVYGTGVQAAGQAASSAPKSQTPTYQRAKGGKRQTFIPQGNPMADILQLKKFNAEIKNIEAQTNRIEVDTRKSEIQSSAYEAGIGKTELETQQLEEQIQNTRVLRENLKQSGMNAKTQGEILKIQKNIEQKNWEYFKDYNVRPQDPFYIREFMNQAEKIINDGSFQEIQKEMNQYFQDFLHLLNIGVGTSFPTEYNKK